MACGAGPGSWSGTIAHGAGVRREDRCARPGSSGRSRPDKLVRGCRAMQRWGRTPAAGYTASAARYPNEPRDHRRARHAHLRRDRPAHQRARPRARRRRRQGGRRRRRSCAATTAASSRPRSPRRSSARTALYLNTAFAGAAADRGRQAREAGAIVFDEEFSDLLEEAGKRRKRFVAWHDGSRRPRRPDARGADRARRPPSSRCRRRRPARRSSSPRARPARRRAPSRKQPDVARTRRSRCCRRSR